MIKRSAEPLQQPKKVTCIEETEFARIKSELQADIDFGYANVSNVHADQLGIDPPDYEMDSFYTVFTPKDLEPPHDNIMIHHGAGEEIGAYIPYIKEFLKEGYRVIGYDLPGMGRSSRKIRAMHITDFRYYSAAALSVLESANIMQDPNIIHHIAHSTGGAHLTDTLELLEENDWGIGSATMVTPWLAHEIEKHKRLLAQHACKIPTQQERVVGTARPDVELARRWGIDIRKRDNILEQRRKMIEKDPGRDLGEATLGFFSAALEAHARASKAFGGDLRQKIEKDYFPFSVLGNTEDCVVDGKNAWCIFAKNDLDDHVLNMSDDYPDIGHALMQNEYAMPLILEVIFETMQGNDLSKNCCHIIQEMYSQLIPEHELNARRFFPGDYSLEMY